jgi:hypothetical protein
MIFLIIIKPHICYGLYTINIATNTVLLSILSQKLLPSSSMVTICTSHAKLVFDFSHKLKRVHYYCLTNLFPLLKLNCQLTFMSSCIFSACKRVLRFLLKSNSTFIKSIKMVFSYKYIFKSYLI